jgi:hypothetical protein
MEAANRGYSQLMLGREGQELVDLVLGATKPITKERARGSTGLRDVVRKYGALR